MRRVDHTWLGGGVEAHAHLGFQPDPPRCWQVYAEDVDNLVVVGRLCALSLHHGPGRKIILGPRWWGRDVTIMDDMEEPPSFDNPFS